MTSSVESSSFMSGHCQPRYDRKRILRSLKRAGAYRHIDLVLMLLVILGFGILLLFSIA